MSLESVDGVFFTLLGVCWALHALVTAFRAGRTLAWARTTGVVIDNRVVDTSQPSDMGTRTSFTPGVWYEYSVAGEPHESRCVFIGDTHLLWMKMRRSAAVFVERYPPGSPVTVHYDPRRPSRAVLEPGVHPRVWLDLATAVATTGLGLFLLDTF